MTRPPNAAGGGNLGDLFRRDVDLDQDALVDLRPGGRTWTGRGLDAAAQGVARELREQGRVRGDRVAIIADNSAEFLCAYCGILRAGMVAVLLSPRLPASLIKRLLDDAGVSLVITDEALASIVRVDRASLQADAEVADTGAPASSREIVHPNLGEIAQILYTSGSTGWPKGVPLSHQGQGWALSKQASEHPQVSERVLIVAPLFHMNGLFNLSVALLSGAKVILLPRFNARAWLHAIADHHCTNLSGIATMFVLAAREYERMGRLDLSSVRRVKLGSAPLNERQVEQVRRLFPDASITNGYGTTEAGASVFGGHPDGKPRPTLSVGYPLDDVQWRLAGEEDAGVLQLRTPAMFEGYLNLPLATAERLRDGWYDTGDLMRRDAEGFFYFAGRADDMFICGGENIYPAEVERMLARHPGVAQAAVVPAPDLVKGQIPIAFVTPVPGATLVPDDLKAFSLEQGPAYSHPRDFVILDALPLSTLHKVDRAALTKAAESVSQRLGRS